MKKIMMLLFALLIIIAFTGCDMPVAEETTVLETESETEPRERWQCRIPWKGEIKHLQIVDTAERPNTAKDVQGDVVWEMNDVPGDYKELGMQLTPPTEDEMGELWFTLERQEGFKVVYITTYHQDGDYTKTQYVVVDLYEMHYDYILED